MNLSSNLKQTLNELENFPRKWIRIWTVSCTKPKRLRLLENMLSQNVSNFKNASSKISQSWQKEKPGKNLFHFREVRLVTEKLSEKEVQKLS